MSRRIPSLLSPPSASASGPQMMLLALRAAGLRFGSFPLSKKQSKVGWHSRESNRDVSIRIHNTRYGRQTEGDVIFCTASFLPPPASFRFRSTALARRKCCSPSRSLPPPPRRRARADFPHCFSSAWTPRPFPGRRERAGTRGWHFNWSLLWVDQSQEGVLTNEDR